MTDREARDLFGRLMAAFPRIYEQATVDLYLGWLEGWEHRPGEKAVEALVRSARSFPSVADLREAYFAARRELAPLSEIGEPGVPPDAAARAMMERLGVKWTMP